LTLLRRFFFEALRGIAEQLATATHDIFTGRPGPQDGIRLLFADFRKHSVYSSLMFHQIFVGLILIHGILANHLIHLFLDSRHEIFGALAVS
jgi:hypothetical protein